MKSYSRYQHEQCVPQIVSKIYDESREGNGKTYIIEEEPLMTSRKTVYDILNGNPDFEAFFDLMLGTDFFETLHNKLYACGGQNIRLFNSYHYTVYVPTNESIYKLQDEGKLPRWSDVELTESRDVADSLTTVIEDFLRYHLQDNSIYIGADVVSGNYETAKVNPETKKFYRLNVNSNSSGITIEDHVGNIRYVTSGNNKNFMAREYQYNTPNAESASKVETSSMQLYTR